MAESHLPHHRLHAYTKATELLALVKSAHIRDTYLRDHALRAAKTACLNLAEGAGRITPRDKARSYAIARAEASEACAAVEIAAVAGDTSPEIAARIVEVGAHLVAMLTRLAR